MTIMGIPPLLLVANGNTEIVQSDHIQIQGPALMEPMYVNHTFDLAVLLTTYSCTV